MGGVGRELNLTEKESSMRGEGKSMKLFRNWKDGPL